MTSSQPRPQTHPASGPRLRIGYWNLREGGVDHGDDGRLRRMVNLLAAERLDVALLGEARWADHGDRRLHAIAHQMSMTFRRRIPSNYYRCDMAILIREDQLQVVEERHEIGHVKPWFHGLGRVETHVPGRGRLDIAVTHLAPSMPHTRLQEAEAFALLAKAPMIVAGDFNAAAVSDPADPSEFGPDKEHKLDDRPARIIAVAGFTDAGAAAQDLTLTVGLNGRNGYRCDRIHHNLPGAHITDHTVITRPDLSDHAAVIAEITL
ncbi:endonuclease/exonuclease/phosphatase family protein [Actinomadura roseirufa]|uniref:endonuclease/exonuclease/phosphatase family protein n=1 Tax=Actinomadura roseirufa TaxID=2094049 RepID=UPI0010410B24|nr:endonuclease/exonuclease/phosphatase family protein [Actinomadura roseirufa]